MAKYYHEGGGRWACACSLRRLVSYYHLMSRIIGSPRRVPHCSLWCTGDRDIRNTFHVLIELINYQREVGEELSDMNRRRGWPNVLQ